MSCFDTTRGETRGRDVQPLPDEREKVKAILLRVRAGEDPAFSELVKIYYPLLKKTVLSFSVNHRNEEGDLETEAMFFLYRAAMTFDVEQARVTFGAYARTCINNALISYARRAKKQTQTVSAGGEDDGNEPVDVSVEEAFIAEERFRALWDVIRHLPDNQRDAMEWTIRGMAPADIAANMGVSVRSVESYLFRARKTIRKYLEKQT